MLREQSHAFLLRPLPLDTFAPLAFNCCRMSIALWPPAASTTFSDPLPRPISSTTLFGSAAPTTGTSEASHCWNGFAMKYPSEVNQRVKGVRM
jgi:hypothetical protein